MIDPTSVSTTSNYKIGSYKVRIESSQNKELVEVSNNDMGTMRFNSTEELVCFCKQMLDAFHN